MSYKIRNNDTVIFEQTKIVDSNNEIAYIAMWIDGKYQGKSNKEDYNYVRQK